MTVVEKHESLLWNVPPVIDEKLFSLLLAIRSFADDVALTRMLPLGLPLFDSQPGN
jgi:hypothetical protein